jgi:ZIP family zinc transporter
MDNIKLGISVAFAIMIHNIPEGIAVAVPICYATKSRGKGFLYSLLSGLAEPLGALAGILILLPFLTTYLLHFSLAFVAGIMIFISFDELLPLSFEHQKNHITVSGILLGMLIMAVSLYLL